MSYYWDHYDAVYYDEEYYDAYCYDKACYCGYCDMENESGYDPYFSIKEAIQRGDLEAIRSALNDIPFLENEKIRHNQTVLHWAAAMKDEDCLEEEDACRYGTSLDIRRKIVRLLLDHGAKALTIWRQQNATYTGRKSTWDMTKDDTTRIILMDACRR